jgi:large subunit ribosomal protein L24
MKKMHIRKGDTVRVLCGQDRGEEGRVLRVFPKKGTAIVEGIRLVSKHMRPSQENPNGGIVQKEAPIQVSNLMLVEGGTPTRTGRKKSETGIGWERYSKNTGEII